MMLLVFLLQVINIYGLSVGVEEVDEPTLCTHNACFTLHMEMVNFESARMSCEYHGGYLVTIKDPAEETLLQMLLSQIRRRKENVLTFWIGLRLGKGDCVLLENSLKGFKWVGIHENTQYSNWAKNPVSTCMERCVKINYTLSGQSLLKWVDGGCKESAFYACMFYFRSMCKPLALLGFGQICYIAPFSQNPLKNNIKSLPLGTYADVECGDGTSHYTVCLSNDNVTDWSVPGPFCTSAKQSCNINNGWCEQSCLESEGEARCTCSEGFTLDDDNKRTCSDVDECKTQACDDNVCVNTYGSYTCHCKEGYQMVEDTCRDVDECAASRCAHTCQNFVGSFSCHCNVGFTTSADGHSCLDIDECIINRCEFRCANTLGSFLCLDKGMEDLTGGTTSSPAESHNELLTLMEQNQSVGSYPPSPDTPGSYGDAQTNVSAPISTLVEKGLHSRVLICVLSSVIPLLLLIVVTLTIVIYRCTRSKKAKKKDTVDGYCWHSSGLEPHLEKLYESVLTDDL